VHDPATQTKAAIATNHNNPGFINITSNNEFEQVECLTSAYNATLASPMAMSTASVAKESMHSSTAISKIVAAKDTNTLAGGVTGSQAFGSNAVEAQFGVGAWQSIHYEQRFNLVQVR